MKIQFDMNKNYGCRQEPVQVKLLFKFTISTL